MPQGDQYLVNGGAVAGQLVDYAAGQVGRDPGELEAFILAPGEETPHDAGIVPSGVRV